MSLSMDRSTLNRLNKEIADLRRKESDEVKKEGDANKKMNTASAQMLKATSASSRSMYASTATRESKNVEAAQNKRAQHSSAIAKKSVEVARLQERISRAEDVERKAALAADEKRRRMDEDTRKSRVREDDRARRELVRRVNSLEAELAEKLAAQAAATEPFELQVAPGRSQTYDVFICHAWKDKLGFVDELASKAKMAGLAVWYDDFTISWGESVRQKIDDGLVSSYFGAVVLSPNFFDRPWTNYELDGLLQRDLSQQGRLLPI